MTKSFKVAGHSFSFDIPDAHPLWEKMGQYAPFEVPEAVCPLFTIRVVESLEPGAMKQVYGGNEEPGQPVVLLYEGESGWMMEMAPVTGRPLSGRMLSDKGFSHADLLVLRPDEGLFALNNAAMLMFAFASAPFHTLEMHASVIANGGRAFLFLAKSGTGKSTHSSQWLKYIPGSRLLNDDNPVVRILEDGTVEAFGSPWSGKTPCYRNEHYPVGAFVQIRRCPENRISRLDVFHSYALLYSSSSGFKTDPAMADMLHSTFEKISLSSPCYVLDCRPDEEAARVCSAEVLK
ncbi:MAG: hypothetical protein II095_05195 [Bacteroidales bacterium]|nr:hypothetical protein [Bacteroidales bacterium]